MDGLLVAAFLIWGISSLVRRKQIRVPKLALVAILVLGTIGLTMIANAKHFAVPDTWEIVDMPGSISFLPGSVDAATSLPLILHSAALLCAAVVLVDLLRDRCAKWLVFKAIALIGGLIAMFGIIQKAAGIDAMPGASPEASGETFFAFFRYHTNAAAFLLLCWPAALALWIRSREKNRAGIVHSFWLFILFIITAGLFVNTSKVGHLVALGLVVAGLVRFWKSILPTQGSRKVYVVSFAVLSVAGAIAIFPAIHKSTARWQEVAEEGGSIDMRMGANRTSMRMLEDSGFFGFGPGSYQLLFPYYSNEEGSSIAGVWKHAHNDYLQALIEWGVIGAGMWTLLVIGGVVIGLRAVMRDLQRRRMEISTTCSVLAVLGVCAIAVVDFPFQMPAIQLLALVYLAGLWSLPVKETRRLDERSVPAVVTRKSSRKEVALSA